MVRDEDGRPRVGGERGAQGGETRRVGQRGPAGADRQLRRPAARPARTRRHQPARHRSSGVRGQPQMVGRPVRFGQAVRQQPAGHRLEAAAEAQERRGPRADRHRVHRDGPGTSGHPVRAHDRARRPAGVPADVPVQPGVRGDAGRALRRAAAGTDRAAGHAATARRPAEHPRARAARPGLGPVRRARRERRADQR